MDTPKEVIEAAKRGASDKWFWNDVKLISDFILSQQPAIELADRDSSLSSRNNL